MEAIIEEKKKYDAEIQPRLTELTRAQAAVVVEIAKLKTDMRHQLAFASKTEQKLEEFWAKEPAQARKKFREAVQVRFVWVKLWVICIGETVGDLYG